MRARAGRTPSLAQIDEIHLAYLRREEEAGTLTADAFHSVAELRRAFDAERRRIVGKLDRIAEALRDPMAGGAADALTAIAPTLTQDADAQVFTDLYWLGTAVAECAKRKAVRR